MRPNKVSFNISLRFGKKRNLNYITKHSLRETPTVVFVYLHQTQKQKQPDCNTVAFNLRLSGLLGYI